MRILLAFLALHVGGCEAINNINEIKSEQINTIVPKLKNIEASTQKQGGEVLLRLSGIDENLKLVRDLASANSLLSEELRANLYVQSVDRDIRHVRTLHNQLLIISSSIESMKALMAGFSNNNSEKISSLEAEVQKLSLARDETEEEFRVRLIKISDELSSLESLIKSNNAPKVIREFHTRLVNETNLIKFIQNNSGENQRITGLNLGN